MNIKHKPYKKNNGRWSCSICKWEFYTRPNKKNCPGRLRIEHADNDYKTEIQWKKLGFEIVPLEGENYRPADAVSIVHSTDRHLYYHRAHVRPINQSLGASSI